MSGNEEFEDKLFNRKRLIRKTVKFNGHELLALYDPGANASYISYEIAKKLDIETKNVKTSYQLTTEEGTMFIYNNGWVTKRTKAYDLQIETHLEKIQLDIISTDDEIVLGRDWSYDHNPEIDLRTKEFVFSRCRCTQTTKEYKEISRKQLNVILRKKPWKVFAACQIEAPKFENIKIDKILEQYRKHMKVFSELKDIKQSKHDSWDHEIPLQEGKRLRSESMRKIFYTEMQ